MGTGDFQVAKTRLLEWFYENNKMEPGYKKPGSVSLAEVLLDYWNHHGQKLVSRKRSKSSSGTGMNSGETRPLPMSGTSIDKRNSTTT